MKFEKIADSSFSARVNFLSSIFSKNYFSVSRNLPRKIIGGGLNIAGGLNINVMFVKFTQGLISESWAKAALRDRVLWRWDHGAKSHRISVQVELVSLGNKRHWTVFDMIVDDDTQITPCFRRATILIGKFDNHILLSCGWNVLVRPLTSSRLSRSTRRRTTVTPPKSEMQCDYLTQEH